MKKLLFIFFFLPVVAFSQTTNIATLPLWLGSPDSAKMVASVGGITKNIWGIDLVRYRLKITDTVGLSQRIRAWVTAQNYMQSFTETDPIFLTHVANTITSTNISNWNSAFSWGNHASAGYLTGSSLTPYLTTATAASTYALASHTHSFSTLTSIPTTLTGYGITDTYTKTASDARYLQSFAELDPKRIVSISVTGTGTKTVTATLADASTVTTTFTDLQGSSATWGSITGTLSSQTDLQTALNAKAATSHTHVASDVTNFQSSVSGNTDVAASVTHSSRTDNPHSVTKAQVGLGNVDNTSDASKPVSTAQATAIATKTDIATVQQRIKDSLAAYTIVFDAGIFSKLARPDSALTITQSVFDTAIARYFRNTTGWASNDSLSYRADRKFTNVGSGTTTNAAPVASSVAFTGTATQGQTLTGTYTYSDAESDPQGTSTKQWYRSDNTSALNRAAISGATSTTYVLAAADTTKYIQYAVTPVATSGTSPGTQVFSSYSAAIAASSSGGSLTTITYPTITGSFFESPTGRWGAGVGAGVSNLVLPASTDGTYQMDIAASNNDAGIIGWHTSSGAIGYTSFTFGVYAYTGFVNTVVGGTGTATSTTVAIGDKLRLKRVSGVVTAEKSTDGGTTWTQVGSALGTNNSQMYVKGHDAVSGSYITNPKATGVQ